jgi:dynactin 4
VINIKPYAPNSPTKPSVSDLHLTPGTTHSFILTVTNPLYDPIRVTLSTPATAPGFYPHRTTVLRPEFTVGANADIWNDDEEAISFNEKEKRRSRFGIFEARRNMVSIFMEVIPSIPVEGSGKVDIPVEIPIFVKLVYQTEDVEKEDTLTLVSQALEDKGKGKVEREIGYWAVVRVGSIVV